jgi:methylase of polypeptide subunit release factors
MLGAPLPSTERFAAISDAALADLRQRLPSAADLAAAITAARPSIRIYDVLQGPVIVERLEARGAHLLALFCFGMPVAKAACEETLGAALTRALVSAGLLVDAKGGTMACPFRLLPYEDVLVFSDCLDGGGNAVFGSGPGSRAFASLDDLCSPDASALDVGCGAGAIMLHLARHVRHVLGTDINPRAGRFVGLNARLNDIKNISFRSGHLFEPVKGQQHNLIVSQLPFMPRPEDKPPAMFRDGGVEGSELWRQFLPDLPSHLADDGMGMLVCETAGGALERTLRSLPSSRWLAIVGGDTPPDAYAIRAAVAQLTVGFESYSREVRAMLRHLEARGIDGLSPAVVLLQRNEGAQLGHSLQVDRDVWRDFSCEHAKALLRSFVKVPEGRTTSVAFRRSPDLLAARAIEVRDRDGVAKTCQLILPRRALISSVTLTPDLLERLWQGPDPIELLRRPEGWSFPDGTGDAAVLARLVDAGLLLSERKKSRGSPAPD